MASSGKSVQRWDIFEVELRGPSGGNPFLEVELSADFKCGESSIKATGFYDGDGVYRIRFMPPATGVWRYRVSSNRSEMNGRSGQLTCIPPTGNNHGPVRVANTFHFAYADGTPFKQIGTTCYVWTHQGDELEEKTLATLKASPFNKIRMCVFPKHYTYNENEPVYYAFEGRPPKDWDFTRFNPAFFRHLERRIDNLRDLGIEADVILLHPYDNGQWGFDQMDAASDDRYLKYVVSRLAAYRNIWWSMANEYDLMTAKSPADWDRYFQIVHANDPYDHLRSIHNWRGLYDHNKPWVTHASIQNGSAVADFGRAVLYRDVYRKPVVFDEVRYEGDITQRWGDLTAEQMVKAFWHGTLDGTYVGHGETFEVPEQVLWWSKGGVLHGQSPARLAFLRQVLESSPATGIDPIDKWWDVQTAGKAGEYYLIYFGDKKPTEWLFELPKAELAEGMTFRVEILDTWNMIVTPVPGEFKIITDSRYRYHAEGLPKIALPGKPYIALRITRIDTGAAVGPVKRMSGMEEEMTG
jgi:hypothetical protein